MTILIGTLAPPTRDAVPDMLQALRNLTSGLFIAR